MDDSKRIRNTDDAFAWIRAAVAAGRIEQPVIKGQGAELRVIYKHACTRCGGDGRYCSVESGRVGVCFDCGGRGMVSKALDPVEFARRVRRNTRASERRRAAKEARLEAARAANEAMGYGRVTGREVYSSKVEARLERRRSARDARQHIGAVGETLELRVALIRASEVQTRYGGRWVHTLMTAQGDLATFWASERLEVEGVAWLRVRAQVKKHGAFDHEARTELAELEVLALEGAWRPFGIDDLLVVTDYLDQDGGQTLDPIERAALANGDAAEWMIRELSEHPIICRAMQTLRAQSEAA